MKKTLLVNYVYYPPIGHAIEALRYTLGYYNANPNYEISLVLSKDTPYFLADLCPWIKKTYTVDLPWDAKASDVSQDLMSHIPQAWDYVVSDARSKTTEYCPEPFFTYYKLAGDYFKAKEVKGYCGEKTISYKPDQQLKFELPKENLDFAEKKIIDTKVKIGIMFAGADYVEHNPSIESWQEIVNSLYKQYPDLSIYLFGRIERSDRGTVTAGVTKGDVESFLKNYPKSVNCFDIALLSQLAIAKNCNVFISPHTGFAFAVLSVGTPWLTISGTHWAEYFYNGVPFYSVLTDCERYPCYGRMLKECKKNIKQKKRVLCMTEDRIKKDIPEILRATEILIKRKWDYQTCLKKHFEKVIKHPGVSDRIYAFNGIHEKFIKK